MSQIWRKQVKIPHISYSEFLKNQEAPERSDADYTDFWMKHINYCRSGIFVGGIFISGWLYWHLNFFKLTIDEKDEYGNAVMIVKHPDFRDNEWMIDQAYQKADKDSKLPLPIVGTRRFAKTAFISSRMGFKAFIFQNSHIVVVGASNVDINNITKYFDEFYESRPDCFSDLMKYGDWTKTGSDVEIAYNKRTVTKGRAAINPITPLLMKLGKDNKYGYSRIAIRNLEHGLVKTKEDLLAGITPTEVIWDEAGKHLWSKQHAALLPAMEDKWGRRCVEIFVATGGNIDFSKDIEEAFIYPKKNSFFHFDTEEFIATINEGHFKYQQKSDSEVGLFVPSEMSLKGGAKVVTPFIDYIKKSYTKKEKEQLKGFDIEVTDWANARKKVQEYIDAEEEKSDAEWKKARMYYSFQPEDAFLTTAKNPFDVEEGKKKQREIKDKGLWGRFVTLDQDGKGNIIVRDSDKKLIIDYPFKGGMHGAPTCIYEEPISEDPLNIDYGTYIGGFDGYKIATSDTTDSVGSFYIFKRVVGVQGMQFQIVASLATRPSQDTKYYRQVFLLLKMYNAEVLPERDTNLFKYMEQVKGMRYWANCKNLVQGLAPNSKADLAHGLPPTPINKEHCLKLVQKYANEDIIIGYEDDDEETPIKTTGISRIPDYYLLEEMIRFGSVKNYDRITAFGHALAWDAEQTVRGVIGGKVDIRKQITVEGLLDKHRAKFNKYRA